jgi:hypothetical protein
MENLSLVFMEIGRSSPRYQELALLYPRSKSLQASINEYFVVIVRFCQNLYQFAQKSTLRQIASSLSDPTVKTAQSELASWAREIRDEVRVLTARRIEEEAEENSRFRSLSKKFSKTVSSQQQLAVKLRVLNSCSSYDYETTWKQIRKIGNTTLFAQSDDYLKWRTQAKSCTLLYLGFLGCGKSVTMANIVDDLSLFVAEAHDVLVVYFFVRHDLPASLKARTIIGAIIRQILRSKYDTVNMTEASNAPLDLDEMLSLLRRSLSQQQTTYLVLDGLDLCEQAERREVTEFLRQLQMGFCVLICASYRREPNMQLESTLKNFLSIRLVSLPNNKSDIETFVETELARHIENRSLILGDPTLILDIQDALLKGSKGMFLWVALQIQSLITLQTDEDLRDALAQLPQDLSEIYAQLLSKPSGPVSRYQSRIFELITAAQRPLTTGEMREALSVTPGETSWSASKLVNEVYSVLATCGCLVVVDEEELTMRFVHPTVEQFLFERYNDPVGNALSVEACHKTMAEIATTYLSFAAFMTEVSTYRVPNIHVGSTPSKVITSTMASSRNAQNIALRLLKLKKRPDFDIGRTVAEELNANKQIEVVEYHFREYAKEYCLYHVMKFHSLGPHIKAFLPALIERSGPLRLSGCSEDTQFDHNYRAMILRAARDEHLELMRILLSRHDHYNDDGYGIYLAVSQAICGGHGEMIQLLREYPQSRRQPQIQLYAAGPICRQIYQAESDEDESYDYTSVTDEDISHTCSSGRTLLACAIWAGNTKKFRALHSDGRIDVNGGGPEMTPIWEAIRQGNEAVMVILLRCNLECSVVEQQALIGLAKERCPRNTVLALQVRLRPTGYNRRAMSPNSEDDLSLRRY